METSYPFHYFVALEFYVNGMDGVFKLTVLLPVYPGGREGPHFQGNIGHASLEGKRINSESVRHTLMPCWRCWNSASKTVIPPGDRITPFPTGKTLGAQVPCLLNFAFIDLPREWEPLISVLVIHCGVFCFCFPYVV